MEPIVPEDIDLKDTIPSAACDGLPGCERGLDVIFLKTGEKMCAVHAQEELVRMSGDRPSWEPSERETRDTDRAPGPEEP